MERHARCYLVFLGSLLLTAGSASAQTCPLGNVTDRDPPKLRSHGDGTYAVCVMDWIQARVNDNNLASHTAEFHDDLLKLRSRETYSMYGINKCSFVLSRRMETVSGPYLQDGKKSGSSLRDFEVIDAIDLKRMDPQSIQTEMQPDAMHGQTAALILQTTAGKKALIVRRKSTVHYFDKVTPDATTLSDDSISIVVIHFQDLKAADSVAEAFQLVIRECGGIGIPNDVDPNSAAKFAH
jgi:hypothetical protein